MAEPPGPAASAMDCVVPAGRLLGPASRSHYLPTLDGWRAIAISVVLLSHAQTMHLGPLSTERFHYYGHLGVDLFFAISGLLICTRLLDEEELTGSLRLQGFYIRRIFRIQPAALLYLVAVIGLSLLHRLPPFATGILASLLLMRNYVGLRDNATAWPTTHFWSLSVEEHFYLILPSLLFLVRRWRARLLLTLAALDIVWLVYRLHHAPASFFRISLATDTNLCLLLLPAGLAVLLRRTWFRSRATRYLHSLLLVPLSLMAVPTHSYLHPLILVLPSLLVLATLLHPSTLFSRCLEAAPLRFIGRISYSLYLWQELFMAQLYPGFRPFGPLNSSWLQWPCVLIVATASYYLIERPCIRLGHRLANPPVEGRPL